MPAAALAPSPDNYLVSKNGRLGDAPESKVTEVARILDLAMSKAPTNGLVIHFHGGLVDRQYALSNIAAPLTTLYGQANAYPLFFIWESGLKEALLNNKADILKDPAFRELVKKVSEWVLSKVSPLGNVSFRGSGGEEVQDIDRFRKEYDDWFEGNRDVPPVEESDIAGPGGAATKAAAGIPNLDVLASDIETALDNDPAFKKAMAEAFNAANPPAVDVATKGSGTTKRAENLNLSSYALDEMFPPEERPQADEKVKTRGILVWAKVAYFVAKIVIAVVKRFRADRDHGVYCTVVEEVLRSAYGDLIGATVWNAMKQDTKDSFENAVDTCGLLVVQKLKALEDSGKSFKKITLVGHSTGAIYICNFLDAAKAANLQTPISVVFLAPAVTCERFAAALTEHEATRLKDFRMFAMRDAREIEDEMLKPFYTRSLLYFVSGLLEGEVTGREWTGTLDMPLVGMERFFTVAAFSDDAKVKQVWTFLNAQPNRMVWSKAAGAGLGLNSDSQHHGDFDNDQSTLQSLVDLIKA